MLQTSNGKDDSAVPWGASTQPRPHADCGPHGIPLSIPDRVFQLKCRAQEGPNDNTSCSSSRGSSSTKTGARLTLQTIDVINHAFSWFVSPPQKAHDRNPCRLEHYSWIPGANACQDLNSGEAFLQRSAAAIRPRPPTCSWRTYLRNLPSPTPAAIVNEAYLLHSTHNGSTASPFSSCYSSRREEPEGLAAPVLTL